MAMRGCRLPSEPARIVPPLALLVFHSRPPTRPRATTKRKPIFFFPLPFPFVRSLPPTSIESVLDTATVEIVECKRPFCTDLLFLAGRGEERSVYFMPTTLVVPREYGRTGFLSSPSLAPQNGLQARGEGEATIEFRLRIISQCSSTFLILLLRNIIPISCLPFPYSLRTLLSSPFAFAIIPSE